MKKILIVDDLDANLDILESLFGEAGYSTVRACDGAEALKKIQQEKPDIVVSDIHMPIMDGFELCRILKTGETTKNIPIVLITSRPPGTFERLSQLSWRPDAYTTYPVQPKDLLGICERLMGL